MPNVATVVGLLLASPSLALQPVALGVRRVPSLSPSLRNAARCAAPALQEAEVTPTIVEPTTVTTAAPIDAESGGHGDILLPGFMRQLSHLEEAGLGSVMLLGATAVSMGLANFGPTSATWLGLWKLKAGPALAGHALSIQGWINEVRAARPSALWL